MNKKILDVTATITFCACLIVAAKIAERDIAQPCREQSVAAEETQNVAAGVCRVLLGYSFTTESDEKTGIARKEVRIVAASMEEEAREEILRDDKNGTLETAEMPEATEVPEAAVMPEVEAPEQQNRWKLSLTPEEIDLLARIVWLESCGEPVEGQEAVVEVIFNRIASDKYPNTLYDVLSQGNPTQFCSWKNRNIAKPTEKEYQSIENVLNGNTNILRNDTLYFSTEPLTSSVDRVIGGHSFCY